MNNEKSKVIAFYEKGTKDLLSVVIYTKNIKTRFISTLKTLTFIYNKNKVDGNETIENIKDMEKRYMTSDDLIDKVVGNKKDDIITIKEIDFGLNDIPTQHYKNKIIEKIIEKNKEMEVETFYVRKPAHKNKKVRFIL